MRLTPLIPFLLSAMLATDALALDLVQVYQAALDHDAQYASARASLAAGQEKAPQARAGLLPVVSLSGSRTHNNVEGRADFSANNYSLVLTQPLFRPANWEQYEQGKLAVALSEAQFAQARQELMVRTVQAYFDVLAAQDTVAFVQAQKSAIKQQLAFAQRNFEVGTSTITDTHEAQARYDLSLAQELAAQSEFEIKRGALAQVTGIATTELAPLRPSIALAQPEPAQMATWVESAERQNYVVISQQLTWEIARREITKTRAGHYPTLDLVASRSHSGQSLSGGFPGGGIAGGSATNNNAIGVQLNIPLFSGFAVTSKVREAIALEAKARSDAEFARRSAAQNARQSYLATLGGLAQIKALETAELSSRSALESNQLGYEVGVRINIDVLNAQQQLFSTRKDLAKARYDAILNGLRLKSAAGTLQDEDIARVNGLLR